MTTNNINYNDVSLDRNNPRFSTLNFNTDKEIISYLYKHESLKVLEESILSKGFNSLGERIIIIKEDNKYVVLEGNRRIAALQNLFKKGKIESFKIPCDIVEKREDALYKISTKHISGISNWNNVNKWIFYYNQFVQLPNNISVEKRLKYIEQFNSEKSGSIRKSIGSYIFFKRIYKNYIHKDTDTTYETLMGNTDMISGRIFQRLKEHLSFTISLENLCIVTKNDEIFDEICKILAISLWESKTINTRILNKKEQFRDALIEDKLLPGLQLKISEYNNFVANKQKIKNNYPKNESRDIKIDNSQLIDNNKPLNCDNTKSPIIDTQNEKSIIEDQNNKKNNSISNEAKNSVSEIKSSIETLKPNETKTKMNPEKYVYLTEAYKFTPTYKKNPRINQIYKELKTLKYKDFTVSANGLIRALLETYANEYFHCFKDVHDNSIKIKGLTMNNIDQKDLNSKYNDVLFLHIEKYFKEQFNENISFVSERKEFSNNNNVSHITYLNCTIHERDKFFRPEMTLNIWTTVYRILYRMDKVMKDISEKSDHI
ncbi:hypothetical protein NGG04_12885 [Mammaliicoccus sciuri]|uniref:ParB N-terminal domain-containing protein n=1 Tax=Mammaliicoccus sciuri TaxID=1296 RepID=UPI002DBA8ED0|nr:ParB N-terminal domain-containing protein [Mammaliicoccus sciuri]MEB7404988.1 hypothetical protein [Mammaliicoccus sciuri]MEB8312764.1 hypothetical protein [Mammaliicoccus sciuri]